MHAKQGLLDEIGSAIDQYMCNAGDEGFYGLSRQEQDALVSNALTQDNFITLNYLYSGKDMRKVDAHLNHMLAEVERQRPAAGTRWHLEGVQYYLDPILRVPVDPGSFNQRDRYDQATFRLQDGLYHFFVNPAIVVEREHKTMPVPEHVSELFHKSGYSPVILHDYEYFERHKGFKAVVDDIFAKPLSRPYEGLERTFTAADYRRNTLINIVNDGTGLHNTSRLFSAEEIEGSGKWMPALLSCITDPKRYIVDDRLFTAFGDKEKIHLQFLELKGTKGNFLIPYFIGLGNNYPFTRAINKRASFGDNRFYRESFDPKRSIFFVQSYDSNWEPKIRCHGLRQFGDMLMKRANDPKKAMHDLLVKIELAAQCYPAYFSNVFDIERLFEQFSADKGMSDEEMKAKKHQDQRLMLNPDIRFRPCALASYHEIARL